MDPSTVVVSATADRWPDLSALFRAGGDSAHCWCAWFRLGNKAFGEARVAGRRQAFETLVLADAVPGLLAYRDERLVGWVSIVPRRALARIEPLDASGATASPSSDVWALTCFVVRPEDRRSGVAGVLLDAAIDHARAAGAVGLEGYPVERARSASSAFPGVVSMFRRRGFREVGRFDRWAAVPAASTAEPRRVSRPPGRPVMRLELG